MIVESTTQSLVTGVVRHALTAAFASWGVTAFLGDEMTQLGIATVLGLGNIAWFVIQKKMNSYKTPLAAKGAVDDKVYAALNK